MTSSLSIGILPLENFTLTPFAALIDIFRLAADEGDGSRQVRINWTVIGASLDPILSSCGVSVEPWEALGKPERFNYLVVCGGLLRRDRRLDAELEEFIQEAARRDVALIGLCTGVFLLAQAGVAEGRTVCVSWYHLQEFEDEFPDVIADATRRYVVDDKLLTCAGGPGAADLAAQIIASHLGDALAQKALNIMVMDTARLESLPQPPPSMAVGVRDPRIRQVALILEQSLSSPPTVERLAKRMGLSRRQLERIFNSETGRSPAAFLAELRLERADWLIRSGNLQFTRIAEMTGFADSSHLTRSYRKRFGRTPSHARQSQIPDERLKGERRPYGAPDNN